MGDPEIEIGIFHMGYFSPFLETFLWEFLWDLRMGKQPWGVQNHIIGAGKTGWGPRWTLDLESLFWKHLCWLLVLLFCIAFLMCLYWFWHLFNAWSVCRRCRKIATHVHPKTFGSRLGLEMVQQIIRRVDPPKSPPKPIKSPLNHRFFLMKPPIWRKMFSLLQQLFASSRRVSCLEQRSTFWKGDGVGSMHGFNGGV